MRTITKTFDTVKQADAFQNRLYNRYEYVRLVRSPYIGEQGTYQWQVKIKVNK